MHNTQERLVTREETSPTSEGVALKHTLARMFGQDLHDTSTLVPASDVPLEVTATIPENSVKLVGDKLIRREDTERVAIPKTHSGEYMRSNRAQNQTY